MVNGIIRMQVLGTIARENRPHVPWDDSGARPLAPSPVKPFSAWSLLSAASLILGAVPARAQSNFEIQVYGSALVPVRATMFELHSNYTAQGSTTESNGMLPTNHALHETVEITHGFNEWFECGFYLFLSQRQPEGLNYVGNHIRPRFSVPERYHLPVGLSLSQEIGYQTTEYSEDTWTWEIRPIIDQQLGRFYWSLNPTVEKSLRGANAAERFEFAPNAQVNLDVSKKVNVALEYYASFGTFGAFPAIEHTEQQLMPAVNLDFGADWEFSAGVGIGMTTPTDHLIAKVIFGRRVGGHRAPPR